MAENTPGNEMSPSKLVEKVLETSVMIGRGSNLQTTLDQFLAELDQHFANGTTALTEVNLRDLRTLSGELKGQNTPIRQTVEETIRGWEHSDRWESVLSDIRTNAQNTRQAQEASVEEGQETTAREGQETAAGEGQETATEEGQETEAQSADGANKNAPKNPSDLVQGILESAVLAGRADAETDAEKKKSDLKKAEEAIKNDLKALRKAVGAKDSKSALTKKDVDALEQVVSKVREEAKKDTSLDAQAIIDTKLEEALQKSAKEIQDKAGKEKDPELTLFNIIKAASIAGHDQGTKTEDGQELSEDISFGAVAEKMLAEVEKKLKGDKTELEGDTKIAFEALRGAACQAANHAAEAGKDKKHFLVDASLDEAEIKALQEKVAALKPALSKAESDAKIFHVPSEEKPRTKDILPAQEAQEAKDGKKAVEAREAEMPGVYDSGKALEQARAGGQTMSKGAMAGNALALAAGAAIMTAGMRSGGGNSQQDPRNPNAEQGKKSGGRTLMKATVITMGAALAGLAVAAALRKETLPQTFSTFAAKVTGGRLGGGQAAQR